MTHSASATSWDDFITLLRYYLKITELIHYIHLDRAFNISKKSCLRTFIIAYSVTLA
jgi:hypothetical protein